MIISPSFSFQCTSYTVTEMLLCLSSSFTIISLNKTEQMQNENPPGKWPPVLAKHASRGAGPPLSPSWTVPPASLEESQRLCHPPLLPASTGSVSLDTQP